MGASRTRQTRAVVSYKLDSSSDESDDDGTFAVPRGGRNDSSRGNDGELDAGHGKGRRNLALKKSRSQGRGEAREDVSANREHFDQNGGRLTDENVTPETRIAAFQHLVDVAVEATDANKYDTNEDVGGAVEDEREMKTPAAGHKSAHGPPDVNECFSSQGGEGDSKLDADIIVNSGEQRGREAETNPTQTARQRPKKSSKNDQASSDDDDWLKDDVVDEASASDFSSEGASDSDVDMEGPAKKRRSTKSVVKKPQKSASRTVTKGPRTDRKVASTSGQTVDNKKAITRPTDRPRKVGSPLGTSASSLVQGTGGTPCKPRFQPVKLRLKMANKEANSDGSPCGSTGAVPAQLTSPSSVPHRRVLGLSRRCRPPPLHPYLAGT